MRQPLTILLLGGLALGASGVAAQSARGIAGVYAVRRVVTSSTCEGTLVGAVRANVFMISSPGPGEIAVVVSGDRRFRELRGTMTEGTLRLAGSDGEDGTIAVSLTAGTDGVLAGSETVSRVERNGPCEIMRAVTATPLGTAAGATRPR